MNLSSDQIEAVKQGEPVRVAAPEVGAECVVLRADVYVQSLAAFDDSLSMEQVARLVQADMQSDDENDPLLDSYQRYRP